MRWNKSWVGAGNSHALIGPENCPLMCRCIAARPAPKSVEARGEWFDLATRTLSSTSSTTSYLHLVRPLSPRHRLGSPHRTTQSPLLFGIFCSRPAAMYTRILIAVPRILTVKRTLATLSPTSAGTGPRLSTTNTNTVSVVTGHHDSPQSPEYTIRRASYPNTPREEGNKQPYMVDGGMSGGFGGIPMGAFAVSTPFDQH
jgi:hypothetical protein